MAETTCKSRNRLMVVCLTRAGLLLRNEFVHKAPLTHWEVSLLWSFVVELTHANGGKFGNRASWRSALADLLLLGHRCD